MNAFRFVFGFKARRRNRLRAQPFSPAWLSVIRQNVPYYDRLSVAEQQELLGDIQVFVAEKNFEGCGGLELTGEIKVTIAAYACILLLHRQHDYYPRLQSILVYPDAYTAPMTRPGPGNTVIEGHETRAGESWNTGAVVVSWNHIRHRPGDPSGGGRNVALHEFAHQLDQENGSVDGAPQLPRSSQYGAWARILGHEYQELVAAADADRPTFLDKYGATNPAEFFAVITEYFFEQPQQLKALHPELYGELATFYRQDPAAER